ncbi:TEL2-interacting protein 1 [Clonorchis sinensis]|uniref:TEL2-interacting protein 1 n=1 Tax=Clonorchis sinensis TaxID=79923 RepID=A0A8T1MTJ2_CLOSI|nr:TEL2-interacting protein 1 [Clonorchis sinensis]
MDALQDICLQLDKGTGAPALHNLLRFTGNCDKESLRNLFVILHPRIRSFFVDSRNNRSDLIELVYRIYGTFFKDQDLFVSRMACIQLFEDLSSLMFSLSSGETERPWSKLSEECCLSISTFVGDLFLCITSNAAVKLYSTRHLPLLSHICSTLLEMAEFSSWRAVRIQALLALQHLVRPGPTLCTHPENCQLSRLVPSRIAQLLPGISQGLFRLITGDVKMGSSVKEAALQTWAVVFVVVFGCFLKPRNKNSAVGGSDTGLFSSEWYERSRSHIHQLVSLTLDNLLHVQLELSFDENNRLSVALVNWLSAMLFQCPALLSLSSLRDTVVAGLITIAAQTNNIGDSPLKDPSSRTSLTASQVLGKFVQSEEPDEVPLIHLSLPKSVTGSRLIRNIASQALYNHINSFAGLSSHVIDEKQLQKRLRTILGYLNVMDVEGLSILTYRRESFHRLCTSLAELLRFSTNSVELLHDCSPQISSSQSVSGRTNATRPVSLFPKSFELFHDSKTLELVQLVACRIAAQEDALDMFVDTCRDVMTLTGEIHRNPCLLLITAGLFGYLQNDMVVWEQRNADCLRIVTEWFDSDLLHLPISIAQCTKSTEQSNVKHVTVWPELPSASAMTSSDTCTREHVAAKDEKPSLKELKQNTITVCLLLELFSTASLIYVSKPANNEDLLRIGLVACTSFAAHPDLVGKTARCCLQQLAINCGYADVHSMITANADFLVSTITLQLHRIILLSPDDAQRAVPPELLTELRSTCHTLETLFEYATMDVLPLLRPLVKQILTCLDLTYEHHADLFLPAFKCLVSTCRWWNEKHYKASPLHFDSSSLALDEAQPPISEPADVMSDIFSLTLRNTRALIEETRRIHNICGPSVSPGGDESTLVSSDTSSLTKLKEEQEEDCARIFPDHLHIVEELLLPLVHKAWASLMARFRDQHAVVVEKAFQLLTVLTKVAGDFIRARASSDILPPLLNFLTRGASVSAGANESFQHLTAYRVQRQLLLQMGSLCVQLGLMSESLRSVMRMLILYLEDDQPQGLQQAAEHSLTRLWRIDPGLIWTCILAEVPRDLQNEVFGQIPSEKFQTCETLRAQEEPRKKIAFTRVRQLLLRLYRVVPDSIPPH